MMTPVMKDQELPPETEAVSLKTQSLKMDAVLWKLAKVNSQDPEVIVYI